MSQLNIVAIIQARMGSQRLPGKVLLDLIGKPMLFHEIERIRRSKRIEIIVVATTNSKKDDLIVDLCHDEGWNYFRGNEVDVLDRYYQTAKKFHADAVVRLTSDCPLIEPTIIDCVIDRYINNLRDIDYVCNFLPYRTFPRGLDTEIINFNALEKTWREDNNPLYREHVTQYILRNPKKFIIKSVRNKKDLSKFRWTVDTTEDFQLINKIYSYFGNNQFSWYDVLTLLNERPELLLINQNISQKEV